MSVRSGDPQLAARLRRTIRGDVLFGSFDRARYSTDASIYEIEPLGVVVPERVRDIGATLRIADEVGISVVPRGAGTSQAGQAIGSGLVIDTSKYLIDVGAVDSDTRTVWVEPGVTLDELNRRLRPEGLFFPVDVATASRATLGGMAANNSSGARSLRYGIMADNVVGVEALLWDGTAVSFGQPRPGSAPGTATPELVAQIAKVRSREAAELERRVPSVLRHVAGYNLHRLADPAEDLTPLLIGSEGTLAFLTAIGLQLQARPTRTVLGVCAFPGLTEALDAVQHIVPLQPSAVELVGGTLLRLARDHPLFVETVGRIVDPAARALLLVEFELSGSESGDRELDRLEQALGDRGHRGTVERATSPDLQQAVWDVRRASLNIVMTMPGPAKPISFIEDCAIPLDRLAEWGRRLTEIFHAHGAQGTWYAHASVGCLHVRPALDLAMPEGRSTLRSIAEQAHELVRDLDGSHSGEHGDGIVRSEFIEPMLGPRLTRAFEEVKTAFDPEARLNPGRIVHPPRMDDPALLRATQATRPLPVVESLDWSEGGGLAAAAAQCNNNGACRRREPGVMCPSYRVTGDEEHVTRGRANTLRLAMAGRLGPGALHRREVYRSMELCVGCKACRRECPMGVDVSRMKVEVLHHYHREHPRRIRDRLIAELPALAPMASRMSGLMNLGAQAVSLVGFTSSRALPSWHARPFRDGEARRARPASPRGSVTLLVDTFTRWFEPEIARAALEVLTAAGYEVTIAAGGDARPLCCGRTYLNAGMIDEARVEARRLLDALGGSDPVLGLEPSCLLTLRDELTVLFRPESPEAERARSLASRALLLTEWLEQTQVALPLRSLESDVIVHGHCHQKAFGADGSSVWALSAVPGFDVKTIQSGCCGMAGAFGYEEEHYDLSMSMAELDLLPAVRGASPATRIVADGTSCRTQIMHGSGRAAAHTVVVLAEALRS